MELDRIYIEESIRIRKEYVYNIKFVNDFDYISINKFENFTAFNHYISQDLYKEEVA